MEVFRLKRMLSAIILLMLNVTLSELLKLPNSLITLIFTINASYIIISLVGVFVGFLGDVLIGILEIIAVSNIYLLRLGIDLVSFINYVALPYIIGITLGSSFLRKLHIEVPKVIIRKHTLSDFLMILGSSLIAIYILLHLPVVNDLIFKDVTSIGLKLYIVLLGLICNSLIITISTQFRFNSPEAILKYILMVIVASFSWLTLPVISLINFNYLTPRDNSFILGKIVKKVGGSVNTKFLPKGYVKVSINPEDNKHIVIVGMSGSGKSYLAMKIIKQLVGRHTILVIDPHGEYVRLARELKGKVLTPTENPVNPLDTSGKPKNIRAEEVSDMVRRIFKLGNIQKYSLYTLILDTYERVGNNLTPTFNDVYETLINYIRDNSSTKEFHLSKEVLNTLIPYLDLLRGPYLSSTALRPDELINGLTVIDLSTIESEHLIGIYVESLLYLIESYVKSTTKPLLMVVDEAHKFMGGKIAPLLSKLVMEGRKFGLGLIIITQQPLDLEASIIANSAYIVSFTVQEVNNVNYISKVLCSNHIKYELARSLVTNLKKHEALVKIKEDDSLYIIKA